MSYKKRIHNLSVRIDNSRQTENQIKPGESV